VPELPEVETIARGLDPALRGRRIARIEVHWPRTVDTRSDAVSAASGAQIGRVRRIGKQVAIELSDGRTLVIHLRMTGRLLVARGGAPIPHERASIHFADGERLAFGDARKFGRIRLVSGDVASALEIAVDPFDVSLDSAPKGNGRIAAVGRVTTEELVALYAGCAGAVQPSLYEGFGLGALEAMSTPSW